MEKAKSISALFATGIAWLLNLSVQDLITWILATLLTATTLIYVTLGVLLRWKEYKNDEQTKKNRS